MTDDPQRSARKRALLAISALVLLLMLPNLVLIVAQHDIYAWVDGLVVPAALLLLFFALFGDCIWVGCLLLVPFALLAPLETMYIHTYHRPTSAEVIATIAATNPGETREYFGNVLLPVLLCVFAALLLPLSAAWWSRHAKLKWSNQARAVVLVVMLVTPMCVAALAAIHAPGNSSPWQKAKGSLLLLTESIHDGFPFGTIQRFSDYRAERMALRDAAAKMDSFHFHARRAEESGKRQVYVLVIGESSRRDHWQLFGYNRTTNPELSSVKNLVLVPDMVTSWPVSIDAIPLLLTRKPVTMEEGQWTEATLLRAMQEAGFETWWISNQLPMGRLDSPITVDADQAQHLVFLNYDYADTSGSYDANLLQPLHDALHDSNHDLFIVLHMMGSHLEYDLRYPQSFKQFRPTTADTDPGVLPGERRRNSYDNTILYTDHVLASIIATLRDNGGVTALWYSSDHGETLPTPICNISGHGIGSRADYQIPVLFWYSNAYAAMFPARVAALRANAGKPAMSADTFESMIDMTGVTFPGHDETWSLFSPKWRYRPRIINFPKVADIDHAMFRKPCDVVYPMPAMH